MELSLCLATILVAPWASDWKVRTCQSGLRQGGEGQQRIEALKKVVCPTNQGGRRWEVGGGQILSWRPSLFNRNFLPAHLPLLEVVVLVSRQRMLLERA